ncbi:hypothetical protein AMIS_53370 [Actinoplanes missouriensis 431]|uniref:DUF3500 domain-containing protein n=1 Tax=Actinoplanes missouriensis (strain ATCC 14538 / DSM 43046 / CBS 188.64 / JCM 3121 / NBRC 102363 / NCIMB 12654 / NRRL B-3342 / UNCC 431) TaxID=512565 RepID=I0HC20_ACTM4|nr:DUF3500 domain-containing protein [Actinoplanes missouriensis]BAL90557.1 hypothetical protein AMIS_53370 [Actinoplanes missouriensis 431]
MKQLLRLAVTAVLLLPVAGCGGDDEETATTTATTAPAVKSYDKSVAGVVEAAEAFLATLDDDQKTEAQLELTEENAVSWSNLPCGSTCRPGISFGDLDASQLAAAKSVLKTALGAQTGSGYERVEQLLLADDYLADAQGSSSGSSAGSSGGPGGGMMSGGPPAGMSGGPGGMMSGGPDGGGMMSGGPGGGTGGTGGYGSGLYYLAFLGTPSTTGTWELNFGGHHLAVHMSYKSGEVVGASPYFVGVEPTSWTDDSNATHTPLGDMKDAMLAMLDGLSDAEQSEAKLSQSFSDVLVGPQEDGQFPATKQGLAVSSLTDDQKDLVLAAIKPWVAGADDATATSLLATYEGELDKTYVGWSGTTGLDTHADYVRIDGPSVWVEFVCQNGVVIQNKIHYHTVYRDHTRDYGGEFSFS